jgi:transposase-like protein
VTSAKTIGIKPRELAMELRAGKTIAQVATAHGVQPQTVIDALKTAATAKIEKAKAAGKISPERATKLEARLDKIVPKFVNDWHLKAKQATAG